MHAYTHMHVHAIMHTSMYDVYLKCTFQHLFSKQLTDVVTTPNSSIAHVVTDITSCCMQQLHAFLYE